MTEFNIAASPISVHAPRCIVRIAETAEEDQAALEARSRENSGPIRCNRSSDCDHSLLHPGRSRCFPFHHDSGFNDSSCWFYPNFRPEPGKKFTKCLTCIFLFAIITEQQAGLIPHLEQLSKKVLPARGT